MNDTILYASLSWVLWLGLSCRFGTAAPTDSLGPQTGSSMKLATSDVNVEKHVLMLNEVSHHLTRAGRQVSLDMSDEKHTDADETRQGDDEEHENGDSQKESEAEKNEPLEPNENRDGTEKLELHVGKSESDESKEEESEAAEKTKTETKLELKDDVQEAESAEGGLAAVKKQAADTEGHDSETELEHLGSSAKNSETITARDDDSKNLDGDVAVNKPEESSEEDEKEGPAEGHFESEHEKTEVEGHHAKHEDAQVSGNDYDSEEEDAEVGQKPKRDQQGDGKKAVKEVVAGGDTEEQDEEDEKEGKVVKKTDKKVEALDTDVHEICLHEVCWQSSEVPASAEIDKFIDEHMRAKSSEEDDETEETHKGMEDKKDTANAEEEQPLERVEEAKVDEQRIATKSGNAKIEGEENAKKVIEESEGEKHGDSTLTQITEKRLEVGAGRERKAEEGGAAEIEKHAIEDVKEIGEIEEQGLGTERPALRGAADTEIVQGGQAVTKKQESPDDSQKIADKIREENADEIEKSVNRGSIDDAIQNLGEQQSKAQDLKTEEEIPGAKSEEEETEESEEKSDLTQKAAGEVRKEETSMKQDGETMSEKHNFLKEEQGHQFEVQDANNEKHLSMEAEIETTVPEKQDENENAKGKGDSKAQIVEAESEEVEADGKAEGGKQEILKNEKQKEESRNIETKAKNQESEEVKEMGAIFKKEDVASSNSQETEMRQEKLLSGDQGSHAEAHTREAAEVQKELNDNTEHAEDHEHALDLIEYVRHGEDGTRETDEEKRRAEEQEQEAEENREVEGEKHEVAEGKEEEEAVEPKVKAEMPEVEAELNGGAVFGKQDVDLVNRDAEAEKRTLAAVEKEEVEPEHQYTVFDKVEAKDDKEVAAESHKDDTNAERIDTNSRKLEFETEIRGEADGQESNAEKGLMADEKNQEDKGKNHETENEKHEMIGYQKAPDNQEYETTGEREGEKTHEIGEGQQENEKKMLKAKAENFEVFEHLWEADSHEYEAGGQKEEPQREGEKGHEGAEENQDAKEAIQEAENRRKEIIEKQLEVERQEYEAQNGQEADEEKQDAEDEIENQYEYEDEDPGTKQGNDDEVPNPGGVTDTPAEVEEESDNDPLIILLPKQPGTDEKQEPAGSNSSAATPVAKQGAKETTEEVKERKPAEDSKTGGQGEEEPQAVKIQKSPISSRTAIKDILHKVESQTERQMEQEQQEKTSRKSSDTPGTAHKQMNDEDYAESSQFGETEGNSKQTEDTEDEGTPLEDAEKEVIYRGGFRGLQTNYRRRNATDSGWVSDNYIAWINFKQSEWRAGRNFRPDVDSRVLMRLVGRRIGSNPSLSDQFSSLFPSIWTTVKGALLSYAVSLPESYDLRDDTPCVMPPMDTGLAATSWAISTAQVVEDRWCIVSGGTTLRTFSTEYLSNCCDACVDPANNEAGSPMEAYSFMQKIGIPGKDCKPYTQPSVMRSLGPRVRRTTLPPPWSKKECSFECDESDLPFVYADLCQINSFYYIFPGWASSIQHEIRSHGSVTAEVTVYTDFLNYKKGVYSPVQGAEPFGDLTLRLIGWNGTNEKLHWIAVGVWGRAWGDKGLVRLKAFDPRLNIESRVSVSDVDGAVCKGPQRPENTEFRIEVPEIVKKRMAKMKARVEKMNARNSEDSEEEESEKSSSLGSEKSSARVSEKSSSRDSEKSSTGQEKSSTAVPDESSANEIERPSTRAPKKASSRAAKKAAARAAKKAAAERKSAARAAEKVQASERAPRKSRRWGRRRRTRVRDEGDSDRNKAAKN